MILVELAHDYLRALQIPPDIISYAVWLYYRFIRGELLTRMAKWWMRKFKSVGQAQRFVTAHAVVQNLFNLGRHLIRAQHYRDPRLSAFNDWSRAVG